MQRKRGKQYKGNDWRALQENERYQGNISCKMGTIMHRNGMDLTEAEDIKRWQEYIEELYKTDIHDPDNRDGGITDLKPEILECEVK